MMALECTIDDSWERRWGIPEWEHQIMTVCIAAICERGRTIIACGDREIGIQITSAEIDDGKWHQVFPGWVAGMAGNVSNAMDVLNVTARIGDELESTETLDVQATIAKAYRQARLTKAEAKFLANRGWTLEEFRNSGAAKLPPSTYATIDAQVSLFDFGADLILAGFQGDRDEPSIITITNPGVCADHTKLGFWCVGSGALATQMSLFAREYSWSMSAEKAAYYVYEAKVAAQKASGVGDTTDLHLIKRGNPMTIIPIQAPTMEKLENIRTQLQPKEYDSMHHAELMNADEFKILRTGS